MTDRRASFEGLLGRSRHHSPSSEDRPDHLEGDLGSELQPTSSDPRRRAVRAKTLLNETSQSTPSIWVDTDKGDPRKAKGGRITPRKASKATSSPTSPESSSAELEKDTAGFLPKLSRILEGKESKAPRRRRSSTISSRDDNPPARRRRRPAEDASLNRRPVRQKHGSLQRRVESLANLPNPSLISVLSGLTQQSSASSGSNSTITQQSYDKTHIVKRKPIKERKRLQAKRGPPSGNSDTMDSQQSSVFHYMNESLTSEQFLNGHSQESRPSTAYSSSNTSHDTEDGCSSSNAEQPVVESPLTSPASTRRTGHDESYDDDDDDTDSDISIRESRLGSDQQPSVSDDVEESDGDEEAEEERVEDEDREEEDGHEHASAADDFERHPHYPHHMALERAPPPRLPSASSSRHSDRHTRRLRRQEQALNEHVLQSPQPHRDFQFVGGPSPYPLPSMPMYDSYLHSGASPVSYYATAQQAPPPAPPPPPIGYYSPPQVPPVPYSPGNDNNFAMAPHPSIGGPNAMVQAPFQYPPAHPPRYQPHPTGPDLSKTTVVGYELLASKLSESSKGDQHGPREEAVVPMYRKFEHLNHRVLLHLQDEIAELEEELRYLDECIAQCSPRDDAGHVHPASRRGDARYGSDLHFRRTELLGRIYLKLGQYNSALSSFSNMLKNLAPAGSEDIQAYRTWIEKRTPIDYAETRFLERKTDLLAVSRGRSASIVGGVTSHQSAAIWLPLILVLPLMAFAIVPGLLGRLLVLFLIGSAIWKLLSSTNELMELMSQREWAGCFSIYFGLMAVLAALVH